MPRMGWSRLERPTVLPLVAGVAWLAKALLPGLLAAGLLAVATGVVFFLTRMSRARTLDLGLMLLAVLLVLLSLVTFEIWESAQEH
jgi:thiol:disulfide interchange protein